MASHHYWGLPRGWRDDGMPIARSSPEHQTAVAMTRAGFQIREDEWTAPGSDRPLGRPHDHLSRRFDRGAGSFVDVDGEPVSVSDMEDDFERTFFERLQIVDEEWEKEVWEAEASLPGGRFNPPGVSYGLPSTAVTLREDVYAPRPLPRFLLSDNAGMAMTRRDGYSAKDGAWRTPAGEQIPPEFGDRFVYMSDGGIWQQGFRGLVPQQAYDQGLADWHHARGKDTSFDPRAASIRDGAIGAALDGPVLPPQQMQVQGRLDAGRADALGHDVASSLGRSDADPSRGSDRSLG